MEEKLKNPIDGLERQGMDRPALESELPAGDQQDFRGMVDNSPDMILRLDTELRNLYANPTARRLLGIEPGEGAGKKEGETGDPEGFHLSLAGICKAVLESGKTGEWKFGLPTPEGEIFLESRIVPEFSMSGSVISLLLIARDVTARVREEDALRVYVERLEQSNRSLQEFASIASHDMQEPLRKIIMFGGQLKKNADSLDEAGRDYLERMHNAALRMQVLLNSLLDYSRVATKRDPFVPVDLGNLVFEVLDDLEARILQTGARVEIDPLPTIDADPSQMRQLFQNLIGNSLKYAGEEKPLIKIHGKPLKKKWQIFFEDNGIGFDEKYAARIFQPFQRLHGRVSPYDGTGMGLAICRKILERHGGSITAKSRPGEGASFMVTIPAGRQKMTRIQDSPPRIIENTFSEYIVSRPK
jgi:two-component system, LuxR family, sensor kinase FixL